MSEYPSRVTWIDDAYYWRCELTREQSAELNRAMLKIAGAVAAGVFLIMLALMPEAFLYCLGVCVPLVGLPALIGALLPTRSFSYAMNASRIHNFGGSKSSLNTFYGEIRRMEIRGNVILLKNRIGCMRLYVPREDVGMVADYIEAHCTQSIQVVRM